MAAHKTWTVEYLAETVRVIYARIEDGFKLLAIAATHDELTSAVSVARQRADDYGIPLHSR